MRFEFFIALRYLFSRKGGQKFISITTIISVLGVALGVGALIVVMGVMTGFTTDLRDKLISVTAQVLVSNRYMLTEESPTLLELIQNVDGVTAATPFVYSELMLSTQLGVKGVIVRGIDPKTAPAVLSALQKLVLGSVDDLNDTEGLPGIIIGSSLAKFLGIELGSRVNLLSPTGQQTMAGFTPLIKPFRVVGVFTIGFGEYDTSMAYTNIESLRALVGYPDKVITGIEVAIDDIYEAEAIGQRITEKLGADFQHQTWMSMNANLFAALKLEKLAMALILTLLIVVGCFSIIISLVMLVMEKTRDIAILLSMGATAPNIRRIFMFQGMVIGCIGTILGYVLGLTFCYFLTKYQFIQLPPGVYSLNYVPVLLEWKELTFTGMGALILCFLATLYPAHQAATLDPVSTLRSE